MKLGVNQWCFPESWPLERVFVEARHAGFDGVELNLCLEGPFSMVSTEQELMSIASAAREMGVELPSVSTALLWSHSLTSPEAGERQRGQEVVRRMLYAAEIFGADTVLVVPGMVTPDVDDVRAYDWAQESLAALAEDARAHRVHIAVENVWNRFLHSPLEMRRFLDEIGHPFVGAYLDVGNVLAFGYPEHWIRILGDRIRKVHVKDFRRDVGTLAGFTALLHGDVDWEKVCEALVEIGYDDYLTAEVPATGHWPDAALRGTASAMTAIRDRVQKGLKRHQ